MIKAETLPMWDEAMMHNRTRLLVRLLLAGYVSIWLVLLSLIFIGFVPYGALVRPVQAGPDLNLVLAPVLVLAALNELIVARVFDFVEGSWRSLVAYLGYGMRRLKAAETEVSVMRRTLQDASAVYYSMLDAYSEEMRRVLEDMRGSAMIGSTPIPNTDAVDALEHEAGNKIIAALARLREAEDRLNGAESKLEGFSDAIGYQRAKRLWVAMLGLMLGGVWALFGSLQLFASLGVAVPARIDVILTGLIIGSIQSPVHSIVGSIQEIKDAVVSRVSAAKPSNSGEDST